MATKKAKILIVTTLLLVSAMIMGSLASCQTTPPAETPADTPAATPAETPGEPEAVKEAIELIKAGKCKYTIVRPEKASEELMEGVRAIRSTLTDLLGGDLVSVAEDWLNPVTNEQPKELEIVVGKTNREETAKVLGGIKYNDWAIEIVGKKLVIVGHTDEGTLDAIRYMMDNFFDDKGTDALEELVFAPEDCYIHTDEYDLDDITINGVSIKEYKVVYPVMEQSGILDKATALAEYISNKTGYVIGVEKDSKEESEYEILVGVCNREESAAASDKMKCLDYVCSVEGNKLVIVGGSIEGSRNAVDAFSDFIGDKSSEGRELAITETSNIVYDHADYLADELLLGENDISEYTIVYETDNEYAKIAAGMLRTLLENKIGVSLTITNDKAPVSDGCEILLGNTNRSDKGGDAYELLEDYNSASEEGYFAHNDKYMLVCGGDGFSLMFGRFMSALTPDVKTETFEVDLGSIKGEDLSFEEVKVMSFNILVGNDQSRFNKMVSIVEAYSPDVIGFQEVKPNTLRALAATFGSKYGYVNLERDNSSKESTPLFYDKTKYNLIESGGGWLSDTPEKMSKFSESAYNRVYVYAILENKETGTRFVHVNTHIDYVQAANTKQVKVLLEETRKFSYLPMFYTADWNMYDHSDGYKMMTSEGFLDSATMTDNAHVGPTMVEGSAPIDFCFTSMLYSFVDRYEVVDGHEYSQEASDHYAIFARIYISPMK